MIKCNRAKWRLGAGLLLSILSAAPAWGKQQVWHFPTPITAKAFVTRHHIDFAERVERETGGKLRIVVHPAGSLFKAADILRAVRTGQAQIGSTGLFLHPTEHPLFELSNLPFLVRDLEEAKKLMTLSRAALEEVLRRKNLKLLYRALWNPQGLFSARRLESPEDVKGMKIRTYNRTTTRIVRLAAGIPTKTEPSEIALAFSTATIDGSFGSGISGVSMKLWDYIDYYYKTNAGFPTSSVFANLDAWEKLDAGTRSVALRLAAETERAIWSDIIAMENSLNATMRQAGMNVQWLSPELTAYFEKIGQQMASEWTQRAGAEGAAILKSLRSP